MWLNKLKIAIIEKDMDSLTTLMESLPKLEDPKEIDEAVYLIKAGKELVEGLRDDTKNSMLQMKKNIDFLNATKAPHTSKLDVKS